MTRPPDPPQLPDSARVARFQQRLLSWYAANGRDLPWRHTSDPYAILVSEVMLQQTQVARVIARYAEWLRSFPTLESLAESPLEQALRLWQGLGYNNRARRLRECAVAVVGVTGPRGRSRLPRSINELQSLPGIGPYTARAVLVFAHNEDVAAVDANVRRVLTHELGLPPALSERGLQTVADAVLPLGRSRAWHNALMDYGALVLTARATGIAPRTRQSPFEGSRRQLRARLLRVLLRDGPTTLQRLPTQSGVPAVDVLDVVDRLCRDGLVVVDGDRVSVA